MGLPMDDSELGYLQWRTSDHRGFAFLFWDGERDKMEAQSRISQQRSAVGHSDVELGGRREGLDTANGAQTNSLRTCVATVDYGFCYPVNRSFPLCHPLTL